MKNLGYGLLCYEIFLKKFLKPSGLPSYVLDARSVTAKKLGNFYSNNDFVENEKSFIFQITGAADKLRIDFPNLVNNLIAKYYVHKANTTFHSYLSIN